MDAEHAHLALVRAHGPAGVRMAPRLLRSAAPAHPTDCALMPCPRGALGNLRFVPLHRQQPGHGEVQVTAQSTCTAFCGHTAGIAWRNVPEAVCLSAASQAVSTRPRVDRMCPARRSISSTACSVLITNCEVLRADKASSIQILTSCVCLPAQIAVRGQGLNFKDVLNVLGMYPGDPGRTRA